MSKLGDHLPLFRLENIFSRQQVEIARSTMCAWLAAAGELARPLVELMAARVRASQVIHTDDTRVPIQAPGERKCKQGRIWTYLGDRDHPYIVFDYTPDRTRAGPTNWLRGYSGYLQADAYGGYDGIFHSGANEVACWAHARRKFFEAKDTDGNRAPRCSRSSVIFTRSKTTPSRSPTTNVATCARHEAGRFSPRLRLGDDSRRSSCA